MKRIIEGILMIGLIVMLMFPTTLSNGNTTVSIDYLGSDLSHMIYIQNATVSFINCTGSPSDISVICIDLMNSTNDYAGTKIEVRSLNITSSVDYTFLNNTKVYNFTLQNMTNSTELTVYINFSSVNVPINPFISEIENLTSRVENLTYNMTILNASIQNLTVNNTNLNNTVATLVAERLALVSECNNAVIERNSMMIERDTAISELSTLNSEKGAIQKSLDDANDEVTYLNGRIESHQNTIDQLSSFLALGYSDPDGNGHIYVNIPWFFIGIISVISILIIISRKTEFGSSSSMISNIGKKINVPFIGKGPKPSPQEWNMIEESDPRPGVENEVLKKKHDEIDKKIAKSESKDTDNGATEEERRKNYWESERGKSQKEKTKKLEKKTESREVKYKESDAENIDGKKSEEKK